MASEASDAQHTLALNTMLEREFVSPLTAIRGAIEILRDFPDLTGAERDRFLGNALHDCARIEQGIEHLAARVYAEAEAAEPEDELADTDPEYVARIRFDRDRQTVEVDFSDFVFKSSDMVNAFYQTLDRMIEQTGERWYILVNYRNCRIWPDAWVAFAHRGQVTNHYYSLGTVRYVEESETDGETTLLADPDLFPSRAEAIARIGEMRAAAG